MAVEGVFAGVEPVEGVFAGVFAGVFVGVDVVDPPVAGFAGAALAGFFTGVGPPVADFAAFVFGADEGGAGFFAAGEEASDLTGAF